VTTIEVAKRFLGWRGLMARNVSKNGVFGLSLEINVPAESENPETCACNADADANQFAKILASRICLQMDPLIVIECP
jgi:hypothetical protein